MLYFRQVQGVIRFFLIILGAIPLLGCPIGTVSPLFEIDSDYLPIKEGAYEMWSYSNKENIWKRVEYDFFFHIRGKSYTMGKANSSGNSIVPPKKPNDSVNISFHKMPENIIIAQIEQYSPQNERGYYYAGIRFDSDYTHIYVLDCDKIKEHKIDHFLPKGIMDEKGECPNLSKAFIQEIAKVTLKNMLPDFRIKRLTLN